MKRLAQWPDKEHEFVSEWKFLYANEAHKHTTDTFKGAKLTGEPAGRSIWVREIGPSIASSSPVDKKTPVRRSSRIRGNNNSNHQSFSFNPGRYVQQQWILSADP